MKYGGQWRSWRPWPYTFVNVYAFMLENNFRFFEQAHELIHVQMRLTSLIKLMMIQNLFLF